MTSRSTASSRLRRIDWGLRDYSLPPIDWPGGWRGSLGLEPTPELYIEHLVGIFREVKRVLRDDGSLWLNIAGCYASIGRSERKESPGVGATQAMGKVPRDIIWKVGGGSNFSWSLPGGFKPKDWVPIPWMLGMALQRDGWWLRSPIIWAKGLSFCETYSGSVMPESVRDRPTTSYEYLLLLTKSKSYYWDQEAVRERVVRGGAGSRFDKGKTAVHQLNRAQQGERIEAAGRNLRSVWAINPHPFAEAHFATFPPKLVEPCIKAGTSERGCCPECGKGWERVVEKSRTFESGSGRSGNLPIGKGGLGLQGGGETLDVRRGPCLQTKTVGWRPGCSCYDDLYRTQFPKARRKRKREQRDAWSGGWFDRVRKRPGKDDWQVEPCLVADIFSGAGTTVMVALRLGRRAVGIELSEPYVEMSRQRIIADNPMFNIPGEAT